MCQSSDDCFYVCESLISVGISRGRKWEVVDLSPFACWRQDSRALYRTSPQADVHRPGFHFGAFESNIETGELKTREFISMKSTKSRVCDLLIRSKTLAGKSRTCRQRPARPFGSRDRKPSLLTAGSDLLNCRPLGWGNAERMGRARVRSRSACPGRLAQ
jgi:hypothetical protein